MRYVVTMRMCLCVCCNHSANKRCCDVDGLECRVCFLVTLQSPCCAHTLEQITVDAAVMMYAVNWNNDYRLINEMLPMRIQMQIVLNWYDCHVVDW